MTDQSVTSATFPAFRRSVRARWAPLLLEPIAGSYERLVIGVAVVGEDGFHLELANALERLTCLYSTNAEGAIYAIRLAADYLKQDLARRAGEAISAPSPAISGISIGECRDAEGESLEAIGASWMQALSSLYSNQEKSVDAQLAAVDEEIEGQGDWGGDRLPLLVMNYVKERREGYTRYFSADLQDGRRRRQTGRSYEVLIDFSGSKLVANFGTLQASGITKSINLIKRRLWDLKVERDRDPKTVLLRQHEMILQRPPLDDPQVTDRQHAKVSEALQALEQQADQEELRLRALNTVAQIGDHILTAEAA
jgi:hypothetical protein